jgi:mercuric ion transport protein
MLSAGLKRGIRNAGFGGVVLVGICCLRIPILLSILTAVGLGFLVKDVFLVPLMILFLSAMLATLSFDYAAHRRKWPLGLAILSSSALLFFAFACRLKPAVYLALAGVLFARIASVFFRRRSAPACHP